MNWPTLSTDWESSSILDIEKRYFNNTSLNISFPSDDGSSQLWITLWSHIPPLNDTCTHAVSLLILLIQKSTFSSTFPLCTTSHQQTLWSFTDEYPKEAYPLWTSLSSRDIQWEILKVRNSESDDSITNHLQCRVMSSVLKRSGSALEEEAVEIITLLATWSKWYSAVEMMKIVVTGKKEDTERIGYLILTTMNELCKKEYSYCTRQCVLQVRLFFKRDLFNSFSNCTC